MLEVGWRRRAGPGILALGLLGILGAGRVGAGDGSWEPPPCESASGPIGPAIAAAARIPTDPSRASWYRLDASLDGRGSLTGQRLTMGIGEDGPRTMALAAESFAAGPVGTLVVSGSDDGRASELQIVDTSAGCAWSVGSERDVVRRATLEPSGEALVEHRVSRRTRADLGIWRRPLDGSAPTLILPPIDPDGRFGRTFLTDLGWSVDGDRLVVQSCGEVACRTRVLDMESGALRLVDEPALGETVGVAGDTLVAYAACRGLPCPLVALDLRSGDRTVLAAEAGLARVVTTAAGARVVHEDGDPGTVRVVDLAGAERATIDVGTARLVPGEARAQAGIALGTGWIALVPDGRPGADPEHAPALRRVPEEAAP